MLPKRFIKKKGQKPESKAEEAADNSAEEAAESKSAEAVEGEPAEKKKRAIPVPKLVR